MRVNEATALAKKYVQDAGDVATALRLDNFVYDDHLAIWTVTLAGDDADAPRVVRISNIDGALISIR